MMIVAGGDSIINFGFLSWMLGQSGMPCYTTSKASIHGMTRFFTRNMGNNRNRVNMVVPGWVMIKRQLQNWMTPAKRNKLEQDMCIADLYEPDDRAAMALWLSADDSRMASPRTSLLTAAGSEGSW